MDKDENQTGESEGSVESTDSAVEADPTPAATPDMDRSALESKVAKGLAGLREIDEPVAEEPVEEAEESPAAEQDESPAEESPEGEEPSESGSDDAEEQPPVGKTPTGPTLPAAYVRTLKAYDWSDEDIARAFKADPAAFTLTAQKMHANRSNEIARWADLGRARKQATTEDTKAKDGKPAVKSSIEGGVKPIDVAGLVEKYGNEELVREIAEPINSVIEQLNAILPDALNAAASSKQAKVDALTSTIEQFFGGEELKPYAALYGAGKNLTDEHFQQRNKVLELADALMVGAEAQGRNLTVPEALALAHDSVSSGFKVQAVRKELKKSVTTRGKSLTLRPSPKGAAAKRTGTPTRTELEGNVRNRLSQIFGS